MCLSFDLRQEFLYVVQTAPGLQSHLSGAGTVWLRLRRLFDGAADLIAVVNAEGNLLDLNDKFEEESGYSRSDMIGRNLFETGLMTRESLALVKDMLHRILEKEDIPIVEVEGVRVDGTKVPCELRAVPIRQGDTGAGHGAAVSRGALSISDTGAFRITRASTTLSPCS